MFSLKLLFARVLPGLALGGLLLFAVYSLAAITPLPMPHNKKAQVCSINSDTVLLLPAQGRVQCLDKVGNYTLAEGDSICNDSPHLYMVFSVQAERPDLAKYGPLFKQHGCVDAQEGGTPFRIEALPIVKDRTTCQQQKGVFVQALTHEKTTVLQCLQQGGLYHLISLETVCNFLAKGNVLLTQSLTLTPGSACYKRDTSSKKVYRGLILEHQVSKAGPKP
ncbi:MAG TPA: hypothetical protein VFN35_03370 [Ktedonobacteraceae bacterium]|nr:hypothetical protein [Ktedonobacteraceae bacterium]